ncbi:hypothetical protein AAFN85_14100 [Mucilaginibacter sp. CAU 1740]|uniref:hypothetical protein n=1 Tax=Mucilaginibacter sp. CAU 1740 TaxID=3140365 RepID=UPI00325A99BC
MYFLLKRWKPGIVVAALLPLAGLAGCSSTKSLINTGTYQTKLVAELPETYNTIDGMEIGPDSSIILSVPNFNNQYLLEKGRIKTPSPAFMAVIHKDNRVEHWYDFKPEDLHPLTGKVGPMDCAFGPDGNLYVNDRQWFYNKDHQSRILRINVKNGKPVDADVVVTGMMSCNGMYWKDSTLFVTESVLQKTDSALYSGVYAFPIGQLKKEQPVKVDTFNYGRGDSHLVTWFKSFNHLGSGADGITFDDKGYLYTTVIEEGKIYRSKLDAANKAVETKLFVQDKRVIGPDGLIFSAQYQTFFLADFLGNAVHAIDMNGKVHTLHKNGDSDGSDGSLDQPAELVLRGNELIIVNMDMAWASKGYAVNSDVDMKFNICKIDLKARLK